MQTPDSDSERVLTQQPRRTVVLPPQLVRGFRERTRRGGPPGSTLIYFWMWDAVRRARDGLWLPPSDSAPPADGPQLGMLWTQTADEFARCKREIERAGSSVRAVLAHRIRRYIAGADPLEAADQEDEQAFERTAS